MKLSMEWIRSYVVKFRNDFVNILIPIIEQMRNLNFNWLWRIIRFDDVIHEQPPFNRNQFSVTFDNIGASFSSCEARYSLQLICQSLQAHLFPLNLDDFEASGGVYWHDKTVKLSCFERNEQPWVGGFGNIIAEFFVAQCRGILFSCFPTITLNCQLIIDNW